MNKRARDRSCPFLCNKQGLRSAAAQECSSIGCAPGQAAKGARGRAATCAAALRRCSSRARGAISSLPPLTTTSRPAAITRPCSVEAKWPRYGRAFAPPPPLSYRPRDRGPAPTCALDCAMVMLQAVGFVRQSADPEHQLGAVLGRTGLLRFWDCCGAEEEGEPGCVAGWHLSFDEGLNERCGWVAGQGDGR